jgi:hypothetical protein
MSPRITLATHEHHTYAFSTRTPSKGYITESEGRKVYNLINRPTTRAMATPTVDSPHRLAPACAFSNRLPFAFDVFFGPCALVVDEAAPPSVDTGAAAFDVGLGDGGPDVGEVVVASPDKVDVTVLPKLIVLGPMMTGTIICSVCPSAFVVVMVFVDVNTAVNSASPGSVVRGLPGLSECSTLRVVSGVVAVPVAVAAA